MGGRWHVRCFLPWAMLVQCLVLRFVHVPRLSYMLLFALSVNMAHAQAPEAQAPVTTPTVTSEAVRSPTAEAKAAGTLAAKGPPPPRRAPKFTRPLGAGPARNPPWAQAHPTPPPIAAGRHAPRGPSGAVIQQADDELVVDDDDESRDTSRRRSTGLLIGGVASWFGSYMLTLLYSGFWSASVSSDCDYQHLDSCDEPKKLLVPIAGPWIARSDAAGLGVILGISQAVGLVLTVAGAYVYATSGKPRWRGADATHSAGGLVLSAAPVSGGMVVSSVLRF